MIGKILAGVCVIVGFHSYITEDIDEAIFLYVVAIFVYLVSQDN